MATYLLLYTGDASQPDSEEAGKAVMAAWEGWFHHVGAGVVDPGNPTGPSATVATDGSTRDGTTTGTTGYSVVGADSLAAATALAQSCPHLAAGGTVEVHEIMPVM
jgi:hypothetical protein